MCITLTRAILYMCSEDWCVHCWLVEKLLIKTGLVTWTLLLVTAAGELMLASLSSVAIYLNRDPLFSIGYV